MVMEIVCRHLPQSFVSLLLSLFALGGEIKELLNA